MKVIFVGDEVVIVSGYAAGRPFLVTRIPESGYVEGIGINGEVYLELDDNVSKTDRSFPAIPSVVNSINEWYRNEGRSMLDEIERAQKANL